MYFRQQTESSQQIADAILCNHNVIKAGLRSSVNHTSYQLKVRLAQLSAAPALHALVLYIPVLHCALREIGSGSACHQRGAQEAGYSVLRPAPSQCIYREGAGAAESYAKHNQAGYSFISHEGSSFSQTFGDS